ncbi:unnamed protein product [Oncorhynchus mykiss]|uniref:PiggyBac transposable element-derived protein domain-containing protein n=1 Tax=Oncorhynchus mykiss TaxID=8022 RepID=A0A060WC56_ONCMY|nr:unnamed protein product [Oncorhynchus mykiss]
MGTIGTAVPNTSSFCSSNSTGACGTVRSNRKGMPAFGCRKMQRGEVEFKENSQQLAVKWHDKRDVHVLSTVQTATMSATGKVDHLTGELKIKPDCVLHYNVKMGAVDNADMINSFVECARKIFFHLIDTVALNGYIVHRLTGEMITEQGIFWNWMYSSHTNHIQYHYAITVTISHPPAHCLIILPTPSPPQVK